MVLYMDKCWYWFEIAKMLISLIIHPSKILDSCHSSEIFGKSKTDSPFQTFNLPHTLKADFDSNIIDDPCECTPPTLGTEQYYIISR